MNEKRTAAPHRSLFFTRQPILDAKRSIWGYELLGGEVGADLHEVFLERDSVAGLASSTYVSLQGAMERGKKIVVAFDGASILAGVTHALPPSSGVVRVLCGTGHDPNLAATVETLRGEGYLILLDVAPDYPLPEAMLRQADIVALNAGSSDIAELHPPRGGQALLLARGVTSLEQFEDLRRTGFALFQGAFFKEPEILPDRKLSSNEISRLHLLRLIETEDPDFKVLADAIRSDPSISFRLLSYLNSAYFGFRQTIQSIDQAIMLLGWSKLKSWIRAVILVDMAGKSEGPQELATLSLQRGKFFELLAIAYDYWGFNPGTLFLLGLFSLLDAMLGMPMEGVVELLPLDAKLKAALRRDANNEYQPLFGLLNALEDGDWLTVEAQTHRLSLDLERTREIFADARDWAGGFFITRD